MTIHRFSTRAADSSGIDGFSGSGGSAEYSSSIVDIAIMQTKGITATVTFAVIT